MARLRLVVGLVVAGAGLSLASPASADCAAPSLDVSPKRVAPGDELAIEGRSWGDACNDTPGPVCNPPPLGEPIDDIRMRLESADRSESVDLGTMDADDEYSLGTTVEVGDIPPGAYLVTATGGGHHATAPVRIVAN